MFYAVVQLIGTKKEAENFVYKFVEIFLIFWGVKKIYF